MTKQKEVLPPDPDCVVRRLIEHARNLNSRLAERIHQVYGHLATSSAAGVLGSLDGAEKELKTLTVLMTFVRDYIPPTT